MPSELQAYHGRRGEIEESRHEANCSLLNADKREAARHHDSRWVKRWREGATNVAAAGPDLADLEANGQRIQHRSTLLLPLVTVPFALHTSDESDPNSWRREDMVGSGFVASLAQPGGNTTGISILSGNLDGKRQEILMEAVPGARHYAALADVNSSSPRRLQTLQEAVRARGAELSIYRVSNAEEMPTKSIWQSGPALRVSTCWRQRCCSPIVR